MNAGDLDGLSQPLNENRGLASERIVRGRGQTLTLLHVVTDWPGQFPNTLDIARRSNQNVGSPTCSEELLSELVEWLEAQGARSAKRA